MRFTSNTQKVKKYSFKKIMMCKYISSIKRKKKKKNVWKRNDEEERTQKKIIQFFPEALLPILFLFLLLYIQLFFIFSLMITTIADVDGNEHLHNVRIVAYFSFLFSILFDSFQQTNIGNKSWIFSFTHKQVYVYIFMIWYLNHNVINVWDKI